MFGPPASAWIAGLGSLGAAAVLLILGYLIASLFVRDRDLPFIAVAGFSLGGVFLCGLVLMVVHMATRGWLFANPWAVRGSIAVIAAATGLAYYRRGRRPMDRVASRALAPVVLVAAATWCLPIFQMLPLTATADTQLHNGWMNQMMNGHTTPGAVISGDVPNYYPWLFHAVGVMATYLTPGRNPYYALGTLQLLLVVGNILALFALGRALWQRLSGAVGAAVLAGVSGGIGFIIAGGPALITDPRGDAGGAALQYGGDLLFARSYNVAMHSIAPPFPRDAAFALTATVLLMFVLALSRPSSWAYARVGIALGLLGLTGGEAFLLSALAVACGSLFLAVGMPRWRVVTYVFVPAIAIYSLWAVPIAINYARLGGFVDITHISPIELPAWAVAGAWGISGALALVGIVWLSRGRARATEHRMLLIFIIVATLMLITSEAIPAFFGEAFDTLGRRHRYWPLLHLGLALLAAGGFALFVAHLTGWIRTIAIAIVGVLALGSPIVFSAALHQRIGRYPILEEALRGQRNVLRVLDRGGSVDCTVAAPQPIAREVFSYTGYRLLLWTGNWYGANRARIRWANIYEHIGDETRRIRDNRMLVNGWGTEESWRAVADEWGIDMVVVPTAAAASPAVAGLPRQTVGGYTVIEVDRCAH